MHPINNNASKEAYKIRCNKCGKELTINVSSTAKADSLHPEIDVYDKIESPSYSVIDTFCYNNICSCGQEISINITDDTFHHPEPEISGAAFIGTKPTVKELADLLIMLEESSK